MQGVWKRVATLLAPRRSRKPRRVTIGERFAHFRAIGAANDAFLMNLASFQAELERGPVVSMRRAAAVYEALSAPVGAMAHALVAMAGGRYQSLLRRYEALDRELELELLKQRPIEFGQLVAWPGDADATRPAIVGPKAARVAEIAAAGVKVPPFFCVTVYAYRLFMEATGVQDVIEETLLADELVRPEALRSFSDRIRAAILGAAVPPQLEAELEAAHRRLRAARAGHFGVAVRSSAVVEDAESSFAGQFETVLNVDEAGLLDAYRRVVASKYTVAALRYALASGFVDEDVAMPVLVMAMVQPWSAGVAYSCAPGRPHLAMVTAVPGLAQPVVDGRVIPDLYVVEPGNPPRVREVTPGDVGLSVRCAESGGVVEVGVERSGPILDDATVVQVARTAWNLERHFKTPQDVEWAIAEGSGELFVVQTRPLHPASPSDEQVGSKPAVEGYRVLVRGAVGASGGVAAGTVHVVTDPATVESVPAGVVLVAPTTSPRLAAVLGSVRAVVTAAGSATGHMATVAREFGVPCVVGAGGSLLALRPGQSVTVDGWRGVVYEGEVRELLTPASAGESARRRDPVRESLTRLLERVAPLTLTEPDSPEFRPANCMTLHDIARFTHQRAMAEMFDLGGLSSHERRVTKRLAWRMPMPVLLLDLGGGLAPTASREIRVEYVNSVPLLALIEGMTDPRLRWSGPVGFDPRGFMSVVVRSAVDDQRYGEPSYAICARDYAHFASRLAYHFATVDAVCGSSVNENYARFLFHGGAAVAERREWRAHFLATVLQANLFAVKMVGDRVEALMVKRAAGEIEDALVMLGRLMVASRHLDMVIDGPATAEVLARAFLAGDFAFERVRRGGG